MGGLFSSQLAVQAGEVVIQTSFEIVKALLTQKFSTVQISKAEVAKAQRIMKANVSSWKESMVNSVTSGVDPNYLDEFAELLLESLQLTDENHKIKIRKTVEIMKFSKKHQGDILEVSFEVTKFRSVYGFLAAMKDTDDTVTFAYAFHSLNFDVELNSLSAEEIITIKNNFGKFQALETLRREGVIKSINYTK